MLFHLGVLRAMKDNGMLSQVKIFCSVSGGSILAAHVALNWLKYNGSEDDFNGCEDALQAFASLNVRGRIVSRWLLWVTCPILWFLRSYFRRPVILERYYSDLYNKALISALDSDDGVERPDFQILSASFTTGVLCSFSKNGFHLDTSARETNIATKLMPLARAVAASSAFPPLFPPVAITRQMLQATEGSFPYERELLTDGGVFDNLGFERLSRMAGRADLEITDVVLSDAGARFDWNTRRSFSFLTSRTTRSTDILMSRVADATLEGALRLKPRLNVIHASIGDELSPMRLTDIVIDLRRQLMKIRTDLNAFSKLEMNLLSLHGYDVLSEKIGAVKNDSARLRYISRIPPKYREGDQPAYDKISDSLQKGSELRLRLVDWADWASLVLGLWWLLVLCTVPAALIIHQTRLAAEQRSIRAQTALIDRQTLFFETSDTSFTCRTGKATLAARAADAIAVSVRDSPSGCDFVLGDGDISRSTKCLNNIVNYSEEYDVNYFEAGDQCRFFARRNTKLLPLK